MDATQLKVGMVIDYRGMPATVVECWTCAEEAPRGFCEPCGAVIEWKDETGVQRCRLRWPEIEPDVLAALKHREEQLAKDADAAATKAALLEEIRTGDPAAIRAELLKQGDTSVKVWGE